MPLQNVTGKTAKDQIYNMARAAQRKKDREAGLLVPWNQGGEAGAKAQIYKMAQAAQKTRGRDAQKLWEPRETKTEKKTEVTQAGKDRWNYKQLWATEKEDWKAWNAQWEGQTDPGQDDSLHQIVDTIKGKGFNISQYPKRAAWWQENLLGYAMDLGAEKRDDNTLIFPTQEALDAYNIKAKEFTEFQKSIQDSYAAYGEAWKDYEYYFSPEGYDERIAALKGDISRLQQEADQAGTNLASLVEARVGQRQFSPGIAADPTLLEEEQNARRTLEAAQKEAQAARDRLTAEQRGKKFSQYEALRQEPDFDLYSGQGAALENPSFEDVEKGVTFFGQSIGGEKPRNIVTYSRENANMIAMGDINGSDMTGSLLYTEMTDDEVDIYNYLLARDGEEAAQEYLDFLDETLRARRGTGVAERVQAIENPVENLSMHALMSVGGGIDQFATDLKQAVNAVFGDGDIVPPTEVAFTNQALLEDLDGLGKYVYSAGNMVGNMLPSIAAGNVSGGAGLAMMGVSAGGNAYAQAVEEGYDRERALAYGAVVGACEALLQKALGGISALSGNGSLSTRLLDKISQFDSALARVTLGGAVSIGSEITEEELQLWLEPAFRSAIFGEEYEGPSGQEMLETAIVTALSTGMLEGAPTVMNEVNTQAVGKEFNDMGLSAEDIQAFIDEGLASDPSTQAHTLAVKAQEKLAAGKNLTNYELGNLYEANVRAVSAEEAGRALVQKVTEEGKPLSNRQAEAILDNPAALRELQTRTGLTLTEDMTQSQRRAAVKEAAQALRTAPSQPLSAAQKAGGVRGRETWTESVGPIQGTEEAGPSSPLRQLTDLGKSMGPQGAELLPQFYDGKSDTAQYGAAFMAYYHAGEVGGKITAVKNEYAQFLEPHQREQAYRAGQADAEKRQAAIDTQAAAGYNEATQRLGTEEAQGYEPAAKEIYLRQSGQRADGANSGGELQQVEGRAGQDQGRGRYTRPKDAGAASLTYGEEVTTGSLGIAHGSSKDRVRLVTGGETVAMASARAAAKARGKRVIFFGGGNLTFTFPDGRTESVNAYITGDRIFVRVDHPDFTSEQLMKHELGHDRIAKGEIDLAQVRRRVSGVLGEARLGELAALYEAAYRGTGLTADEVWEEVVCDSLGDMNIFSETPLEGETWELLEAARATAETEAEVNRTRGPSAEQTAAGRYGLTDEETSAVLSYKSSESYKVNAKLRDGLPLTKAEQAMVEELDRALEKLPEVEGTVYRTITFDDLSDPQAEYEAFIAQHTEGMFVRYKAYTSTSTKADGYPLADGVKYAVTLEIVSRNARDLAGFGNNFESEALFPRRSVFDITKVTTEKNGRTHIYMEEVQINGGDKHQGHDTQKRSMAVRDLQEAHSAHADLQGVPGADTRGNHGRGENLQGAGEEVKLSLKADSKADETIAKLTQENEALRRELGLPPGEEQQSASLRQLKELGKSMGPQGSALLTQFYDGESDTAEYGAAFMAYYHAGETGGDIKTVQRRYAQALNSYQREAAYLAGQVDAQKRESAATQQGAIDTAGTGTYNETKGGEIGRADQGLDSIQRLKEAGVSETTAASWVSTAREAEKKYGIAPNVYLMLQMEAADMESLQYKEGLPKAGEAIPKSKDLQIMEAVYSTPGLSDKQRTALFTYLGVDKSIRHYNKAAVKEHLDRMRPKAGEPEVLGSEHLPAGVDGGAQESLRVATVEGIINPWGFKIIQGEHSVEADLRDTNPKFSTGRAYKQNCQRCVSAYEARRRGFDVHAMPRIFDGTDTLPYMLDDTGGWPAVYKDYELVKCGALSCAIAQKKVVQQMLDFGDGSRAIVRVVWKRCRSGHLFIAENHEGVISFVDPQRNGSDVEWYFKEAKPDSIFLLRTDDKEFTDLIRKCCE